MLEFTDYDYCLLIPIALLLLSGSADAQQVLSSISSNAKVNKSRLSENKTLQSQADFVKNTYNIDSSSMYNKHNIYSDNLQASNLNPCAACCDERLL